MTIIVTTCAQPGLGACGCAHFLSSHRVLNVHVYQLRTALCLLLLLDLLPCCGPLLAVRPYALLLAHTSETSSRTLPSIS